MGEGTTTFVGLDAHKESITVAMLVPGEVRPIELQCTNDRASVRRMVRKVRRQAKGELRFCNEGRSLRIRATEVDW